MKESQTLGMEQVLRQGLSQQQLRYVRLLEMTAPELDEAVAREVEENPALDAETSGPVEAVYSAPGTASSGVGPGGDGYFWRGSGSREGSGDVGDYPVADSGESLADYLRAQLAERSLPETVERVVRYLIDSVDANGYLRRPIGMIEEDLAFHHGVEVSHADAEEALRVLKSLDPAGVGAIDLRESLLLQLRRLPESEVRDDAIRIIEDHYDSFVKKHSHRIVTAMHVGAGRVEAALALIVRLHPKPGAAFGGGASDAANVIVPDFVIGNEEGRLYISLNNHIPELRIDRTFAEAVEAMGRERSRRASGDNEFLKSRFVEARDFIKVLRQRQETMMAVMTAIVDYQRDYFETEDVYRLRPMLIKDIAAATGLDISTVSRATANKYAGTPWGVFPLRFFFTNDTGAPSTPASAESGDDDDADSPVTGRQIEAEIRRMVEGEDKAHPLSDEYLTRELTRKGYSIKRRTVAKYRDRLGIPVSRLRKSASLKNRGA